MLQRHLVLAAPSLVHSKLPLRRWTFLKWPHTIPSLVSCKNESMINDHGGSGCDGGGISDHGCGRGGGGDEDGCDDDDNDDYSFIHYDGHDYG